MKQTSAIAPQIQALHDQLETVNTDAELDLLAQKENEVFAARAELFGATPKLGQLALHEGVVIAVDTVEAEREAGRDTTSHNTAGRHS